LIPEQQCECELLQPWDLGSESLPLSTPRELAPVSRTKLPSLNTPLL
jgi:hypothetical protein